MIGKEIIVYIPVQVDRFDFAHKGILGHVRKTNRTIMCDYDEYLTEEQLISMLGVDIEADDGK